MPFNPFERQPECDTCGSENLEIGKYEYLCLDCKSRGLTPRGHESVAGDEIYDYYNPASGEWEQEGERES